MHPHPCEIPGINWDPCPLYLRSNSTTYHFLPFSFPFTISGFSIVLNGILVNPTLVLSVDVRSASHVPYRLLHPSPIFHVISLTPFSATVNPTPNAAYGTRVLQARQHEVISTLAICNTQLAHDIDIELGNFHQLFSTPQIVFLFTPFSHQQNPNHNIIAVEEKGQKT